MSKEITYQPIVFLLETTKNQQTMSNILTCKRSVFCYTQLNTQKFIKFVGK